MALRRPRRGRRQSDVELMRVAAVFASVTLVLATTPADAKEALGRAASTSAGLTATTISGQASVIDGDTLKIHGMRIRLHGIDAPESRQTCRDADGGEWRCGQQASFALQDHISQRPVTCEQVGVDRYRRIIAVCTVGDEDMNAWMVRNGWALAYRRYSMDYVDEESMASRRGIGVWRGSHVPPWQWRRRR